MEAPKCQFCGKKEWRHVCAMDVAGRKTEVKIIQPPMKTVVIPEEKKETVKEASKGKFDRVAYQREYMRKWRAKK